MRKLPLTEKLFQMIQILESIINKEQFNKFLLNTSLNIKLLMIISYFKIEMDEENMLESLFSVVKMLEKGNNILNDNKTFYDI